MTASRFVGSLSGWRALMLVWTGATVAFGLALTGVHLLNPRFWERLADTESRLGMLATLPSNILIPGVAFALALAARELTRRAVAARFDGYSQPCAGVSAVVIVALVGLLGWFAVAPLGSRWHSGPTDQQRGQVALAGPCTNLALALIHFAGLSIIFVGRVRVPGWLAAYGYAGFLMNAWLALCVLLPVGSFDGAYLRAWNQKNYWVVLSVAIVVTIVLANESVLQWLLRFVTGV